MELSLKVKRVRPNPTSVRILVVEDEPLQALDVADAVEEAGHVVVGTAATCDQALKMAESETPDLAITDLRLAEDDRDGIDVALILRRKFDIPSVFLSANQPPDDDDRLKAAEPLGWLRKPIARSALLTQLAVIVADDMLADRESPV